MLCNITEMQPQKCPTSSKKHYSTLHPALYIMWESAKNTVSNKVKDDIVHSYYELWLMVYLLKAVMFAKVQIMVHFYWTLDNLPWNFNHTPQIEITI